MDIDSQPGASRPITCLSVDAHNEIADHITHYFGCIEFCEQKEFYESLTPPFQNAIKTELRRVEYLRNVLTRSSAPEDKSLVDDLENIHKEWKSKHFRNTQPKGTTQYDPNLPRTGRPDSNDQRETQVAPEYSPDKDFKAYVISLSNGEGTREDNTMCQGDFPNQKIPVHDLLRAENSPLRKSDPVPPGESRVRYFHLPSNNMKVRTRFHRRTRHISVHIANRQHQSGFR